MTQGGEAIGFGERAADPARRVALALSELAHLDVHGRDRFVRRVAQRYLQRDAQITNSYNYAEGHPDP